MIRDERDTLKLTKNIQLPNPISSGWLHSDGLASESSSSTAICSFYLLDVESDYMAFLQTKVMTMIVGSQAVNIWTFLCSNLAERYAITRVSNPSFPT